MPLGGFLFHAYRSERRTKMRKLLIAVAVMLAVLVATIIESSAQTINGCVNKKTGALRVATDSKPCTKSETSLSCVTSHINPT